MNRSFGQRVVAEEPASSPSALERWRERIRRGRAYVRPATMFVAGIAAALVALLLYHVIVPGPHQVTTEEVNQSVAHAMASATPAPAYSAQVYQVIQPSLVLIQDQMPGADQKLESSLGSGVIINDAGAIMTSLHVVDNAKNIKVTFADGTESSAQVTTKQPENDIAVLRAAKLPKQVVPATLGNPGSMRVGDEAYAVGNPFGLYGTMTSGVISGFDRSFQPTDSKQRLQGLIQIDAAVNPGNSGGPLVNRDGEVIGIVAGLINPTEQNFFVGIGFAVPITTAGRAAGAPPF